MSNEVKENVHQAALRSQSWLEKTQGFLKKILRAFIGGLEVPIGSLAHGRQTRLNEIHLAQALAKFYGGF
jgi:hypothetical protein